MHGSVLHYQITNLLSHWRHVLAANLTTLDLANKQSQRLILSDDHHEWVTDTAELDFRAGQIAIKVLNGLPLGAIYLGSVMRNTESYLTYRVPEHESCSSTRAELLCLGRRVPPLWWCQVYGW